MATLLPSILAKYNLLTASGFAGSAIPPPYHDKAPVIQSGLQLYPPYTIISLVPREVNLTFESFQLEETQVKFMVYDVSEANLDMAIAAIRWNGSAVSLNAGFDNGDLPSLTDETLVSMLLTRTPVKYFAGYAKNGANTYRTEIEYVVTTARA